MDSGGLPSLDPGSVWLVGAGPGDPALLTLLAAQALKQAEVIVHDALLDPRLFALANPAAERIDMGKRGGRASSPTQPEITALLIELARAGKRVLRLKGGDPFLFGRGPEEAMALKQAGIPVRVVPGVTAGIGGLAAAGIPATSGQTGSSVTFLTGHGPKGDLPPDVDWDALARAAPVLVVYMGLRTLPLLAERLLAAGRSPDTPAAAVSQATTERQQVVVATLATLAEAVTAASLPAPALVVIGEVVALRDTLA